MAHAAPVNPAITIALFSNFFIFRLLRFQRQQPLNAPGTLAAAGYDRKTREEAFGAKIFDGDFGADSTAFGDEIGTALYDDLRGANLFKGLGQHLRRLRVGRLLTTYLPGRKNCRNEYLKLFVFHGLAQIVAGRAWLDFGLEMVGG